MSKKQDIVTFFHYGSSQLHYYICRMPVSILILVFSFSSFFPAFANASLDNGRHSTIIKAEASSQANLNVITEAESVEEDKADYINYDYTALFLFSNIEADYSNNLAKRLLALSNDINRRPRLQFFVLYHCWKSHLS
ncbi:hypothetical protein [Sediminibacterium salmoneum]|uniref:hypothetical protein n=1 Tax=Sediminibacterium salmoneum TaxID=426421 RepID=UPI0004AF8F31|nr:hypothetical protein [Sediminibacterium salmoneum]